MYRDILGFSITPFMKRVMSINGFFASIMRTGKKAEGSDGSLPPGVPIPILPVDYLKVKPESWIGGEGSYVCPIDAEWGLWFNFSMNNQDNTAVLTSVKGMNPITGQRVEGYELGQYTDECPVHKKPFSTGKLCTECGFKWPAQNYISKPNQFFLDGFRTPDGNVRQFYFTEDMAKSVPELVIGKEDTVPAFGFCFYKLKDYKTNWESGDNLKNKFPENLQNLRGPAVCGMGMTGVVGMTMDSFRYSSDLKGSPTSGGVSGFSGPKGYEGVRGSEGHDGPKGIRMKRDFDSSERASFTVDGSVGMGSIGIGTDSPASVFFCSSALTLSDSDSMDIKNSCVVGASMEDSVLSERLYSYSPPIVRSAEVGIGAGAKIKQGFETSRNKVEDWETKPAGVIRIYFVFQEEFEKYASAGFNSLEGNESGYLEGVPVGGSHE